MWILCVAAALLLCSCDRGQIFHILRPNSVVLAFGDNNVFGEPSAPGAGYPAQLENSIRRRVVDAGVPGELSAAGARRLPGVLAAEEPDLVILCHGGNDLRLGLDPQQLRDNLRQMFEAVNRRGIPVVMIAADLPGTAAQGSDLYRALAAELETPLVPVDLGPATAEPGEGIERARRNDRAYQDLAQEVLQLLGQLGAI
jgi:lysophospholipase L1-like esterase